MVRKRGAATKNGAKRYTEAEKEHILEVAKREGLSGPQAAKRFKVNIITYYRWRGPVRGRRVKMRDFSATGPVSDGDLVRDAVRAHVQSALGHADSKGILPTESRSFALMAG